MAVGFAGEAELRVLPLVKLSLKKTVACDTNGARAANKAIAIRRGRELFMVIFRFDWGVDGSNCGKDQGLKSFIMIRKASLSLPGPGPPVRSDHKFGSNGKVEPFLLLALRPTKIE